MNPHKHLKQLTTLWVTLLTILVIVSGIALLFIAAKVQFFIDHPGTQSVMRSLAGLLIVSIAIALLWQFLGKRAFLDEIMAKARLSEDIRRSGLLGLGMDYLKDAEWDDMFNAVKKLDIVFSYGYTWRRHSLGHLRDLAKRSGCRVRVVLPDPDNETLVSELATQFGIEPNVLKTRILEAKTEFDGIFAGCTALEYGLWYLREHPAFTYYRLDNTAVVAFYSNRRPYEKPPFLKIERGGSLYDFFGNEFRFLLFGNPDKKIAAPTLKVSSSKFPPAA